jgi:hypothetical protein
MLSRHREHGGGCATPADAADAEAARRPDAPGP